MIVLEKCYSETDFGGCYQTIFYVLVFEISTAHIVIFLNKLFSFFACLMSLLHWQALEEMAKKNNGKITCPRTGLVCNYSEVVKAYIS